MLASAAHRFAVVRSVDIFQIHGTILEFHGWNRDRRQGQDASIPLARCHSSVCKTRQSGSSQVGDADTMVLAKISTVASLPEVH